MRVPRPLGSCHQCWTSPSRNCRPAARSRCSRTRSGRAERQGHHVLELVAEPEGAARLVVAGARPQPAAHVLIEQPAVHQQVEGVVRRADLDRVEDVVPAPVARLRGRPPRPPRDRAGSTSSRACSASRPCPRRNTRRRVSPGASVDGDVQRRAGIEPRAEAAGELPAAQGRRPRERAVAAEERRAVARGRAQRLAGVREGHAPRELLVVGVPGQDRAGRGVELGHDVRCPGPARGGPSDPLVVREDAQATRRRRSRW